MNKSLKIIFTSVFFLLLGNALNAQDGKEIFDTKCKACHSFKNKLVGPALAGITDKRSEEWLASWIKNNEEFSTKDEDAKVARVMGAMPNFDLPDAEMKALITYMKEAGTAIEEATPSVNTDDKGDKTNAPVVDNNNYVSNQYSLLILLLFIVALILIIVHLMKNIKNLAQSETFKNIHNKMNNIILLVIFSTMLTSAHAQTVNEVTDYFIKISRSQLWMIAAVVLLLALIALHLANKLNNMTNIIAKAKNKNAKGIFSGFTQAVDIEDEDSILMDHEYDGIRELDNDLPPWWKWGFAITVIFSIVYYLQYQVLKTLPNQANEYAQIMKEENAKVKEYLVANNLDMDASNVTLLEDSKSLDAGKIIFAEKCAVCHKQDGSGSIGANLTDKYWLYGNTVGQMFTTIKKGTKAGMPPQAGILNSKQIQQVASYIKTLPPAKGKEAQGKLYE